MEKLVKVKRAILRSIISKEKCHPEAFAEGYKVETELLHIFLLDSYKLLPL